MQASRPGRLPFGAGSLVYDFCFLLNYSIAPGGGGDAWWITVEVKVIITHAGHQMLIFEFKANARGQSIISKHNRKWWIQLKINNIGGSSTCELPKRCSMHCGRDMVGTTYYAVGCVKYLYVRRYILEADAVRVEIICNRIKNQL